EWYPIAHAWGQQLANELGVTLEQAVGVLAVLSPQNAWEVQTKYTDRYDGVAGNRVDAQRVIEYFNDHKAESIRDLVKGIFHEFGTTSLKFGKGKNKEEFPGGNSEYPSR